MLAPSGLLLASFSAHSLSFSELLGYNASCSSLRVRMYFARQSRLGGQRETPLNSQNVNRE